MRIGAQQRCFGLGMNRSSPVKEPVLSARKAAFKTLSPTGRAHDTRIGVLPSLSFVSTVLRQEITCGSDRTARKGILESSWKQQSCLSQIIDLIRIVFVFVFVWAGCHNKLLQLKINLTM